MKSLLRTLLRGLCHLYPFEHGKYSILDRVYFRHLAPKENTKVITSIHSGIKMNLDLNEFIQSHLYLFGSYELPTIKFIKNTVKPNMTILDIGGNVGLMTLLFSKFLGNTGQVHTFEPEPRNFADLLENININQFKNITLNQLAVSDKDAKLKFYLSNSINAGTHSLVYNNDLSKEFLEVTAIKADDYIRQNNIAKVDLIKIDVEGAELDVINGMDELLSRDTPILIVELISKHFKARGLSSVLFKKMMYDKYKYLPHLINNDGSLTQDKWDNENNGDNIIFMKE